MVSSHLKDPDSLLLANKDTNPMLKFALRQHALDPRCLKPSKKTSSRRSAPPFG
jgi:hypothetical protein